MKSESNLAWGRWFVAQDFGFGRRVEGLDSVLGSRLMAGIAGAIIWLVNATNVLHDPAGRVGV